MKIGIVGYGWVGKATKRLFPNAVIYDKNIAEYKNLFVLDKCDIVFIAVPTPFNKKTNKFDCSELENAIALVPSGIIVIRSTIPPEFADEMTTKYKKRIVVHPEFLGETPSHPMLNNDTKEFIILGGEQQDRRKIIELYTTVYNSNMKINQVTNYEAALIKLTDNRAAFFKLMQMQELYDACEANGADYYVIRDAVYGDDPRLNLWWTFIFPNKRGANSKCLPKDVYGWAAWAETSGFIPMATLELLKYNETLITK